MPPRLDFSGFMEDVNLPLRLALPLPGAGATCDAGALVKERNGHV